MAGKHESSEAVPGSLPGAPLTQDRRRMRGPRRVPDFCDGPRSPRCHGLPGPRTPVTAQPARPPTTVPCPRRRAPSTAIHCHPLSRQASSPSSTPRFLPVPTRNLARRTLHRCRLRADPLAGVAASGPARVGTLPMLETAAPQERSPRCWARRDCDIGWRDGLRAQIRLLPGSGRRRPLSRRNRVAEAPRGRHKTERLGRHEATHAR